MVPGPRFRIGVLVPGSFWHSMPELRHDAQPDPGGTWRIRALREAGCGRDRDGSGSGAGEPGAGDSGSNDAAGPDGRRRKNAERGARERSRHCRGDGRRLARRVGGPGSARSQARLGKTVLKRLPPERRDREQPSPVFRSPFRPRPQPDRVEPQEWERGRGTLSQGIQAVFSVAGFTSTLASGFT